MAVDPDRRSAARLAFLIALPLALVAGVISLWALGGFGNGSPPKASASPTPVAATAAVIVPAAPLTPAAAEICRAVVAGLPLLVRDAARRPVSTGPEQNAAYGDPPLTLSCGAAPAPAVPDATLWVLSGVCWQSAQASADVTVWTTVDRRIPVRVDVPAAYQAPGQWVVVFSAPIASSDPVLATTPAGCRGTG